MAGGAWALTQTTVRSDLTTFMPQAANPGQRMLVQELRRGPVTRTILLALEGGSREQLADASRLMQKKLRASNLFVRVANGEQLFDDDERRRLFAFRYLLSPTSNAARFSAESLRSELRRRLRELASPLSGFDKRLLPEDPTVEFRTMLAAWRGRSEPRRFRGVWFSPDGERALLVAETHAPGFEMDAQQRVVDTIRAALLDTGRNDIRLTMSGPGVFTVASRNLIRAEAQRLGIVASVLALLVLLVSYRSLRLLLLGGLPLVSAIVFAVVAVDLVFGGIHGISLAFGVTVIGVAIDYPIHLFSHLHGSEPVARSLTRIWPTVRLGAVTTAMGYIAMSDRSFPGLRELATFAIVGLLTAAVCTRWILPSLLPSMWVSSRRPFLAAWYPRVERPGSVWTGVVLAAALLSLATLLLRDASPWQDDIAALSPIPANLIALDRELRGQLAVSDVNHLVVVEGRDAEQALARSESLAEALQGLVDAGLMDGFDYAARYLPSAARQKERQRSLPTREVLEADLKRVLADLPFKANVFRPFVDAVAASRAMVPMGIEDLRGSTLGLRVATLLFPVDGGWNALVPLAGVHDPAVAEAWMQRELGDGLRYLDLKRDTNRLMSSFRERALIRVSWGALVIALVLWVGLRDPRRVLLVMLPGLCAIVVDIALLLQLGETLSLFHLVSLLLVLGISIDYGLFFSRGDDSVEMRVRTFHGLTVCVVSTVTVFGVLAWSELPVLGAIGATVAIGVTVSFATAMLLAQHALPRRASATA